MSEKPAAAATPRGLSLDGFDASLFKRANRLHVQDHALFTFDHHLVINPEEVAPENEPQLINKVLKHYATEQPTFYAVAGRAAVASVLAELVPVSTQARKESLVRQAKDVYIAEQTGQHPKDSDQMERLASPMTSYIRQHAEAHNLMPDVKEAYANGLACYLLVQEALYAKGYRREPAALLNGGNSDALREALSQMLGIKADALQQSLQSGGVAGLAALLKVPNDVRDDIARLVADVAEKGFSANQVENWMVGHRVAGLKGKPLAEVIEVGKLARASTLVELARARLGKMEPSTIDKEAITDRMVAVVRDMPKVLQQALYLSGTEISATIAHQVSPLIGFQHGALGQHWFLPTVHGGNDGVRHIYVSSANNTEQMSKTLQHEAHHLTFPKNFSADELKAMDALLEQSAKHISGLQYLCQAWLAGNDAERGSVAAEIDEKFAASGTSLKAILGGSYDAAKMHRLVNAVDLASRDLDMGSPSLKAHYPDPESRAAEMVSRFASIKYVVLRDAPDMLRFALPQMEKLYTDYYLPHLSRAVEQMQQPQTETLDASAAKLRDVGTLMTEFASGKYRMDADAPALMVDSATASAEPLSSRTAAHAI